MVVVFSLLALVQILLRVFIERSLATRRAEVVRYAFIFRCASRRFGRHVHAAYGVYESLCHFESPFVIWFYWLMLLTVPQVLSQDTGRSTEPTGRSFTETNQRASTIEH